jgi:hypothetical protein
MKTALKIVFAIALFVVVVLITRFLTGLAGA